MPAPRGAARAARVMLGLPDRLPALLLAVGLAALLAVLAGRATPVVVLPLAALFAAATWRLVPPPPPATRGQLLALGGLAALVAGWVVLGLRSVAEYVVVNRDPGFLTLKALWLTGHPAAPIPVGAAQDAAAALPGAGAATEAFALHGGALHAQGSSMLPALLAVQGWAGGERAVLAGNVTIGAVGLVAVFALARRLVGPGWALLPVAALGLSLPYLVLTRAAYTEPLTVAFLCGGLAVALGTWQAGGHRSRGGWALAGLLVGAVGTARIDGAVAVAGLAVGVAVVGATPLGARDRREAVRGGVAALAAASAAAALGLVDVLVLSPDYVGDRAGRVTALLVATAALVAVAVAVLLVPGRLLARTRRVVHARRRWLGTAAAVAVVVLGVVLASRPLWWQAHHTDPGSGYGYAVSVLQQAAGEPVDPSRSYDERTLAWVSWYLGVPAVVLGFAGLALLARRAVLRRDAGAALVVAVVGVAAVFPLVRVSITPDQVWAVRRLVPATFPGLLVAATCALAALAGSGRWPSPAAAGHRGTPARVVVRGRQALAAVLAAAVVAFPLTTWRPGAGVVELSGRATQAHAVCDALDDLGVDRVVWTHSSPFRYLATLRVLCDVEVVELLEPPSADDLAAIRSAWGGGRVAALSFDAADYPWSTPPSASVGGTWSQTLGRTLTGPPREVDTTWSEVWVGLVQEDGTVVPAG